MRIIGCARRRWRQVIFSKCAIAFYRLPSTRYRFDWRVTANSRLDRKAPFALLRRFAYLKEVANAAPEEEFSNRIRHELERRRHER